jgi:hypothetical protein
MGGHRHRAMLAGGSFTQTIQIWGGALAGS